MTARIVLDGNVALRAVHGSDKAAAECMRAGIGLDHDIVLVGKTIGNDMQARAVGKLGQARGIAADDDGSVLARKLHELDERSLNLFERAVVIEMVGLNVGDNHHVGVEIQKRAVGLIGLAHEILARAIATVGVIALDNATDQEAGVKAHTIEHRGAHGRGGRLAMSTRNGNRRMAMAQGGKHLRARPNGNAQLASTNQLGVRLRNSRGDNHHVGLHLVDGLCLMTHVDVDAGTRKLTDITRGLKIGARHDKAALVQHEGDTAHASATNPDKVGALKRRLARCILDICHRSIYSLQRINNLQPVYCTATLPDRPKRCVICAIPLWHRQASKRRDLEQARVQPRAYLRDEQDYPAGQARCSRSPGHRYRHRRT